MLANDLRVAFFFLQEFFFLVFATVFYGFPRKKRAQVNALNHEAQLQDLYKWVAVILTELHLFLPVLNLTSNFKFKSHFPILHIVIKTFIFWNQFPFLFPQPLIHFFLFCFIAAKSCTAPCVNLCKFQNALIHIFANWQVIGKDVNELI